VRSQEEVGGRNSSIFNGQLKEEVAMRDSDGGVSLYLWGEDPWDDQAGVERKERIKTSKNVTTRRERPSTNSGGKTSSTPQNIRGGRELKETGQVERKY